MMPGQVLFKLRPQASGAGPKSVGQPTGIQTLDDILQRNGVKKVEQVIPRPSQPKSRPLGVDSVPQTLPDLSAWYKAEFPENADVKSLASAIAANPGVAAAEPDFVRKLAPIGSPRPLTNDPKYTEQWHLAAIRAPEAWAFLQSKGINPGGSRDVVVAVIDTGVDYNHPDLAVNMWTNSLEAAGRAGVDDDGNGFVDDIYGVAVEGTHSGNPIDLHGHGTHVAGIIAAQGNNNIGGVGVAYNVKIMAIRAAQYSGVLSASDIAEGINYAVSKGADVINMSFGGYARSQIEEDALFVAFGQAVLVAAAGNDGLPNEDFEIFGVVFHGKPMYPAAYNWVLGVMASDPEGRTANFSNWDVFPENTIEYEVCAPGVDILSTLPNGQYAAWDGTSMAAPIVSGMAALARSYFTNKDVYSSRFIMGQIVSNGADAYKALAVYPKPKLSYLQHWLFDTIQQSAANDADGIVDAGETIDLAFVIRNHWGKADNVEVNLRAYAAGAFQDDPFITFATSTVNYGAVGSFSWDDNGLIHDAQGAVTGVSTPFRFTVSSETPNDHIIPMLVTMTARNGLDQTDTETYSFESRFNLVVQRGRELPRIISQNMTLTKNDYWIVPGQTLVQSGVTVTVQPGTQLTFGSSQPSDPYSQPTTPVLQVEGTLLVQGTYQEPVEIFPGFASNAYILPYGRVDIQYAKIVNLQTSVPMSPSYVNSIDHSYIDGSGIVLSNSITNTILKKLSAGAPYSFSPGSMDTVLVDSFSAPFYQGWRSFFGGGYCNLASVHNTVLLQSSNALGWELTNGSSSAEAAADGRYTNNAFLSKYWNLDTSQWIRFAPKWGTEGARGRYFGIASNYWGTTSTTVIDAGIHDTNDDFNIGQIVYQPVLSTPAESTYPFVANVVLSTQSQGDTKTVGAEPVTVTVIFNRDMDTAVQPQVSFGPAVPYTDYPIKPVAGGWQNPRTWKGTFNVNALTGDGYQFIRVAGPARAASDPWLVIGDDGGRLRFEIITSGTEAMNLQATGKEGSIDLSWMQDDFDLLAGFSLYRSTSQSGTYSKLNSTIIPTAQKTYIDTAVQPGQPYFYKFTVVKTDMIESKYSNIASAAPIDTIPPVIQHTPISSAPLGLPLQIFADITDNVGVTAATLYYRAIGGATYTSASTVKTTGNRWSANIPGSQVAAPGLQYYITGEDGVNITYHGNAGTPHQITVVDQPVVTAISPNHGPAAGGTVVTIAGTNFKTGATVRFGTAVATNITVDSSAQITSTSPIYYPSVVDITVTNPDGKQGTLLRAFTYEGTGTTVLLPNTTGDYHGIVEIPLSINNVEGLRGADITITFASSVLQAQSARAGNLAAGWSIAANTATAGRIVLSLAGSTVASGSGNLAHITFRVVGNPLATTPLTLDTVRLNDSAITATLSNGSFTVNDLFDVSGRVTYYQGGAGVPGAGLNMIGSQPYAASTNANGDFSVTSLPAGNYTLTPTKSDQANGITSYDASQVLQAAVGLITLSANQQKAADVNKSGSVSAMDAAYILEKAAGLTDVPFPGAGKVWEFIPPDMTYQPLDTDKTGQNFTAILIGDVSGNWTAAGGGGGQAASKPTQTQKPSRVGLPQARPLRPASPVGLPAAFDATPPVIQHTPVGSAPWGLPLTISADITDNVAVTAATLFYRAIGGSSYTSAGMAKTTGNTWSATIPGAQVIAPGLQYYLTAEDGINIAYNGSAVSPHQVTVEDKPVVTAISPIKGPAAGGAAVTITGTNFKTGATVKFGTALATGTTVASSTQITATSPAYYPSVVDITITNPDGKQGILLRGFTFEATGVSLSIPNASADPAGSVEIPISVNDVGGLRAADIVVTFNSSVLSAQSVRLGNLVPGWMMAANTSVAGRVNLSLAGAVGVGGSGHLAHITFNVVGSPLATTPLTLDTVRVNDGAITETLTNGSFTVNSLFNASGRVTYYQGGAAVAGVTLNTAGSRAYTASTNTSGDFSITGLPAGPYTLTPTKSDQANGISSYDASLVLQSAVGLLNLSSNQQKAADVDKSGAVSSMDASYILEKSAGLTDVPFPGAGRVWEFAPSERSYQPLDADKTGQDFTAILIGDVSGTWSAAGGGGQAASKPAQTQGSTELRIPQAKALPSEAVTLPLSVTVNNAQIFGADIVVSYDPSVLSAISVSKAELANNFSLAVNLNQAGQIRIAMASATPAISNGNLLSLKFNAIGTAGKTSPLTIQSAQINESAVATQVQNGSISVAWPKAVMGSPFAVGNDDQIARVEVRISDVLHPGTLSSIAPTQGINGFDGLATFDKNGINILDVKGVGPFAASLSVDKRNDIGKVTFSHAQIADASHAPLGLVQLAPRLLGSSATVYNLQVSFNSISSPGGGQVSQDVPTTIAFRRGDARADGSINIADALFIAQYLAGMRGIGPNPQSEVHPINAASVKTDGATGDQVTIADALLIAQYLAGLRDDSYNLI